MPAPGPQLISTGDITIRAAKTEDAEPLTAIAFRAKAHWGYSDAFMAACEQELSVDRDCIQHPDNVVMVAVGEGRPIGFYLINRKDDQVCEFDALFVEPAAIGSGIGRMLFRHAIDIIAAQGGALVEIQSDPYAEDFYRKMGAVRVGKRESDSIPGRDLPVLRFDVESQDSQVR